MAELQEISEQIANHLRATPYRSGVYSLLEKQWLGVATPFRPRHAALKPIARQYRNGWWDVVGLFVLAGGPSFEAAYRQWLQETYALQLAVADRGDAAIYE